MDVMILSYVSQEDRNMLIFFHLRKNLGLRKILIMEAIK